MKIVVPREKQLNGCSYLVSRIDAINYSASHILMGRPGHLATQQKATLKRVWQPWGRVERVCSSSPAATEGEMSFEETMAMCGLVERWGLEIGCN